MLHALFEQFWMCHNYPFRELLFFNQRLALKHVCPWADASELAQAGSKYIIMVDDLNMPAREKYFAQPPLELLRQWMDHSGWYDRKLLRFREMIDTIYVAAMGPPGGGRNPISNRLLRHFSFISFTEIEADSLERIFSTITGSFIWIANSEEGTVSGRVGGPNRNREKENRTAVREGGTRTRRRGRRRRGLERDERRGANHASARTTRLSVSVVPSPVTGTLQHAPMAAERSRRSQPQDGRTRGLSRTALRSARP